MSILDTLITNRTSADVSRAKELNKKGFANMTAAEKAEYLAGLKGVYNAIDLNRVVEACEYVADRLHQYGYAVDVQKIPHRRGGQGRLPQGYTELDYIRSSGTQFINTGFVPNADFQISVIGEFLSTSGNQFMGAYSSDNVPYVEFGILSAVWFAAFGQDYGTGTTANTSRHQFSIKRIGGTNSFSVDGTVAYSNTHAISGVVDNFRLFGRGDINSSFLLASCTMEINNEIVRDFVPCKNPSNAVGLYDMVTGQFFGNSGSGDFVGGQSVEPPPIIDYEWLESDIPTPQEMEIYISNIQNLRKVFTLIAPQAPTDAERMTYQEANDIETILIAVDELLERVIASFVYSGQTHSGIVWEAFNNG